MWRLYRAQVLLTHAVFGVVALVMAVRVAVEPRATDLGFALLWTAILIWNGYWFLARLCYRLELGDGGLYWYTPLRHGHIPLSELRTLTPFRLAAQIHVISSTTGRPVLVWAGKGFTEFAGHVQQAAPHVAVRVGRYARVSERMPGFNRFKG
jgi:hypothetical protein